METFLQSTTVFDVPGGSDHSPCLVSLTGGIYRRKCPFKFFTFFSTHPDYHNLLREALEDVLPVGTPMVNLCKRLRAAKIFCKTLNRNSFSNVQLRSKEAFERLTDVQRQLHSQPSQSLFEEEKQAQETWNFWSATEEAFFMSKSRICWLKDGDSNTRFFYQSVKSNLAKNTIHYLRYENGNKVTDPDQLKVLIEHYYTSLLGSVNLDIRPLSNSQINSIHTYRCNTDLASRLVAIPSAEEIRLALLALPRNKVPGPDGFSSEFFTSSGKLVGTDVIVVITEFFTTSRMQRQVNVTTIALIPKNIGAEKLADFRPLSCCNTVYKVIAQIIDFRLKWFLDEAVQNNQVGFVSGKLMYENVLLASELVVDFQKPAPTTRGCLQIDLTKVYDNLDWRFLLNILEAFDLPSQFIALIRECISTPSYSIAFNGELVCFFLGKKGIRQGDPMSSSFFVMAMDVLSKQLDAA